MAGKEEHPLLKKPLYIFSLPPEILNTITLKGNFSASVEVPLEHGTKQDGEGAVVGGVGCTTCNIASFADMEEQREHVRSDLHKFNLKRKLAGQQVVNANEFDKMLEDLNESISGSETTESSESSTAQDTLSKLFVKHTINDRDTTVTKINKSRSPLIWFTSPVLPQPTSLGMYRAMFDEEDLQEDPIALIRYLQIPPPPSKPPKRTIGLMMLGGGHFAGIIASLVPKIQKNHQSQEERSVDIIASKTFHRYTTRRKQGGAQSASDASKGKAHSAGSALRRYNESALQNEVRELLNSWKDELNSCEFIFIRATGTINRRTLFGYEGAVMKNNDPRIRGFPFTTRRPTKTELLRCFNELTGVKISHVDEATLVAKVKATPMTQTTTPKPKVTEEDKAEQRLIAHSSTLAQIVQRKKIPALTAYLKENNLSPDFDLRPKSTYSHTSTLLHLAASLSIPSIVSTLLSLGANPEITNAAGKTPFELAGDRATRDRFRLARHTLGETKWDWEAAKVGRALSEKEVHQRDEKEQSEIAEAKAQKAAEVKRIVNEALKPNSTPSTTAGRTGRNSGIGTLPSGNAASDRGLTDEMKVRIERERRARAAEARFAALGKRT